MTEVFGIEITLKDMIRFLENYINPSIYEEIENSNELYKPEITIINKSISIANISNCLFNIYTKEYEKRIKLFEKYFVKDIYNNIKTYIEPDLFKTFITKYLYDNIYFCGIVLPVPYRYTTNEDRENYTNISKIIFKDLKHFLMDPRYLKKHIIDSSSKRIIL